MKKLIIVFIAGLIVFASCKKSSPSPQRPDPTPPTDSTPVDTTPIDTGTTGIHDTLPGVWYDNDNMLLGDPGNAMPDEDSVNNFLMRKADYSVSYSKDRGESNWVSWHLYAQDFGSAARQDDFRPDDQLPASWYHVTDASYVGAGFDRGHNCPAGDRTSSATANSGTFLMTNVIPQAPKNNQNTWNNMETYIRDQVNTGMEAYIIMGSYGTGGIGSNGYTISIDNGHVIVPSNIWKVVVLIANGNNDTSRITTSTRVIAVDVPNRNDVDANWKIYRTSVDAIETATGYDLLSRLPVLTQATLESKIDNQ